ncbi:MAG: hypothetical protein ACR2KK_06855 [Acidimicrobiales bacterium]
MITYCPRCGTQFRESALGESIDASRRCTDCALTVTEAPLMLAPAGPDEEVQYDLFEWEMAERSAATTALHEVEIPYRWEADLVLVVPAVAEDEVDLLLDELDDVEETDDEGAEEDAEAMADGGEEAQAAMGDLFVAADRLQHDPHDDRMAADAMEAATTVAACGPPYGIERTVWKQIQGLASTLATDLEEAADEDTVATDARALREYLRDLV